MKVLILYDSIDGQTQSIADGLPAFFSPAHEIAVHQLDQIHKDSDLHAADLVIIGAPVHHGAYAKNVAAFIRQHLPALKSRASAFFSVSLAAAGKEEEQREGRQIMTSFLKACGWDPDVACSLAGALRYQDYNFLKRWMMKKIMKDRGGETDTSTNHEYTDWKQVESFARQCETLNP